MYYEGVGSGDFNINFHEFTINFSKKYFWIICGLFVGINVQ